MRLFPFIPVFLLVAAIATAVVGCGRPPRRSPEKRVDFVVNRLSRKLDLSDEQKQEVRRLAEETMREMQSRHDQWDGKRAELRELMLSDELSADRIEQAFEQHAPEREEMRRYMAERLAEFHAILTAEQRRELVELMDEKWDRHRRSGPRGRGL